mmetsp:Transcript_38055/g.91470  ORF Transcript_38055/g.91470 Transcript_38055/m.91470 type:complete len:119 (+) Transcript_38055:109-465(+)
MAAVTISAGMSGKFDKKVPAGLAMDPGTFEAGIEETNKIMSDMCKEYYCPNPLWWVLHILTCATSFVFMFLCQPDIKTPIEQSWSKAGFSVIFTQGGKHTPTTLKFLPAGQAIGSGGP